MYDQIFSDVCDFINTSKRIHGDKQETGENPPIAHDKKYYVMGEEENIGAGYGLKVTCVYHLYGPKVYIGKIK